MRTGAYAELRARERMIPSQFLPRLLRWDLPMIEHGRCQRSIVVLASAGLAVALLSQSAWAQITGHLTRAEIAIHLLFGSRYSQRRRRHAPGPSLRFLQTWSTPRVSSGCRWTHPTAVALQNLLSLFLASACADTNLQPVGRPKQHIIDRLQASEQPIFIPAAA